MHIKTYKWYTWFLPIYRKVPNFGFQVITISGNSVGDTDEKRKEFFDNVLKGIRETVPFLKDEYISIISINILD